MTMTPVGKTSLWIAANRALETESNEPLYRDPFARELAGQTGFDMISIMKAAKHRYDMNTTGPSPYITIRTKFFDDALLNALNASAIQQVVILAAGMDARAFRLDWPSNLVFFEVDRDEVFVHKEAVLGHLQARPKCDRRIVSADLTEQWTTAPVKEGFDQDRPAAFLMEGLLAYLDADSVAHLFSQLNMMAHPGSWLGFDISDADTLASPRLTQYLKQLEMLGSPWIFGINDPKTYLAKHGWRGIVTQPGEPDADYGRWPYPTIPHRITGHHSRFLVTANK